MYYCPLLSKDTCSLNALTGRRLSECVPTAHIYGNHEPDLFCVCRESCVFLLERVSQQIGMMSYSATSLRKQSQERSTRMSQGPWSPHGGSRRHTEGMGTCHQDAKGLPTSLSGPVSAPGDCRISDPSCYPHTVAHSGYSVSSPCPLALCHR